MKPPSLSLLSFSDVHFVTICHNFGHFNYIANFVFTVMNISSSSSILPLETTITVNVIINCKCCHHVTLSLLPPPIGDCFHYCRKHIVAFVNMVTRNYQHCNYCHHQLYILHHMSQNVVTFTTTKWWHCHIQLQLVYTIFHKPSPLITVILSHHFYHHQSPLCHYHHCHPSRCLSFFSIKQRTYLKK